MESVGALQPPFHLVAVAVAASADGSVVVGAASDLGQPGFPSWAFRWTENEGTVPMGPQPQGSTLTSNANAVSADGSVITGRVPSGDHVFAFRWTSPNGFELLGGGSGVGVSADGSVLAINNLGLAYRWTQATGLLPLGDLPGGPRSSSANGVSADGSTIVGRSFGLVGAEAFWWSEPTGMIGLGDLPGGGVSSTGWATSADGSVVVGQGFGDGATYAFIWDQQRGMRRLQDVLSTDYGLDLTGWRLGLATSTTPDGRTVVGGGVNPQGQTEAFVAYLGPCPGDFNRSSSINSQDFFDYLNAFFAGDAAADMNHDGLVNSQDFFDYLTAFFAGCP